MPEFVNPFSGIIPSRKLTDAELARALRLDLAAEEEAIHLYEAHADATDHPLAKKVLLDIANEECVHAGEFQHLISLLLKDEETFLVQGSREVDELAGDNLETIEKKDEPEPDRAVPSVGDLKP